MSTRKIKDAKDLETGEKIYLKGHAKATYMSNGVPVEDAIKELQENGGGSGGGTAEQMVNVTYDELVALRDSSQLVPGQKYRMTDYETMTSTAGTQSAGHPFDLILTALDMNVLDEKCSAIHSARDTEGYFADSKLEAWEVHYCLDNDQVRFSWVVVPGKAVLLDYTEFGFGELWFTYNGTIEIEGTTYVLWVYSLEGQSVYTLTLSEEPSVGDSLLWYWPEDNLVDDTGDVVQGVKMSSDSGKGVIYRLVDERMNDVSYDFKNIMFTRTLTDGVLDLENGTDTYVYTFCQMTEDGVCCDMSLSSSCYLNSISNCFSLGNNVFINQAFESCFMNVLKDCSKNTFGGYAHNNYLGYGCNFNVFGEYCRSNHFAGYCSSNTFGGFFQDNTFKEFCCDNVIGKSCIGNTFGNDCKENQIGNDFRSNSIGNGCWGIKIPNVENSESTLFENNTIGNDLWYVNIIVDEGISGYAHYYSFADGIKGSSNSLLDIHIRRGNRYETKVAMNSRGELKIYCEADLVS